MHKTLYACSSGFDKAREAKFGFGIATPNAEPLFQLPTDFSLRSTFALSAC